MSIVRVWCLQDSPLYIEGGLLRFGESIQIEDNQYIQNMVKEGILSFKQPVIVEPDPIPVVEVLEEDVVKKRTSKRANRKRTKESSSIRERAEAVSEGLSGTESSD